ncbi:hypothetical protein PSAR109036_12690 [Psychrobacter arenosus]|uniref:hypothetical protein n=1 Tax=Psychrobacter arenosus TaxID=256326 RepID=UPI001917EE5D|nr:hypothetical protein [Psychrobacter arenosus]
MDILIVVIALLSLLVSYAVFQSNDKPKIIVYIEPHYGKESFVKLIIENIGKSTAFDVNFHSDRCIPFKAFGLNKLQNPPQYFTSGLFVHGIKTFTPKQKYIFDWGQLSGLKEALDNEPLYITATYQYKYPLNLWKSKIKDESIVNINELDHLPMSQGGTDKLLKDIHNALDKINSTIQKNRVC